MGLVRRGCGLAREGGGDKGVRQEVTFAVTDMQKGMPWHPLFALSEQSQITAELPVRRIRALLRDGPGPGRRSAEPWRLRRCTWCR